MACDIIIGIINYKKDSQCISKHASFVARSHKILSQRPIRYDISPSAETVHFSMDFSIRSCAKVVFLNRIQIDLSEPVRPKIFQWQSSPYTWPNPPHVPS